MTKDVVIRSEDAFEFRDDRCVGETNTIAGNQVRDAYFYSRRSNGKGKNENRDKTVGKGGGRMVPIARTLADAFRGRHKGDG